MLLVLSPLLDPRLEDGLLLRAQGFLRVRRRHWSSASSVIIRCHASLSSRLPGTIAAAPFLGFNALALHPTTAYPFASPHLPVARETIRRQNFPHHGCTAPCPRQTTPAAGGSRKIAHKFIPQSSRPARFRARKQMRERASSKLNPVQAQHAFGFGDHPHIGEIIGPQLGGQFYKFTVAGGFHPNRGQYLPLADPAAAQSAPFHQCRRRALILDTSARFSSRNKITSPFWKWPMMPFSPSTCSTYCMP